MISRPYSFTCNAIHFKNFNYLNRWHRLAFSVKGNSVTLLADCGTPLTKKLDRSVNATVSTDGLILTGIQLIEGEKHFMGDLQQLLIADTPDEAYQLCTKYTPSCGGISVSSSSSRFTSEASSSGHAIASSAEVSRSSSSSSFSGGSSRTGSSASSISSSASSGSSRFDATSSRERIHSSGGSANINVSGSRQVSGAQLNRGGSSQIQGQINQSGGRQISGNLNLGRTSGSREELGEVREEVYGELW